MSYQDGMYKETRKWRVTKRKEMRLIIQAMNLFNFGSAYTPRATFDLFKEANAKLNQAYAFMNEENWKKSNQKKGKK